MRGVVLDAFRVLRRAAVQFERYGWLFILANLLAVIVSFPIITAPAAYAGLSRLNHAAQTGITASYTDFWTGFREHFRRGLMVAAANVIVLGMLWINFTYYSDRSGLMFVTLRTAWTIILIVWFGLQFYVWPILDEMEQPTLRGAFQNAIIMLFQNPGFSLTLLLVIALIVILSTLLVVPWLLLTGSIIACISNAAVLDRLKAFRSK